ncbi:MAG: hypothetical protein KAT58_09715 [candidate division Zixibacteria bacterium]|nr:hypothetical protein [candidate division Zixibacteria bacterium]
MSSKPKYSRVTLRLMVIIAFLVAAGMLSAQSLTSYSMLEPPQVVYIAIDQKQVDVRLLEVFAIELDVEVIALTVAAQAATTGDAGIPVLDISAAVDDSLPALSLFLKQMKPAT